MLKQAYQIFDDFAEKYKVLYDDISGYIESLVYFCNHIKVNSSILEIGCGPGNYTKFLYNKLENCKIYAIDLAPKMLELAQQTIENIDHYSIPNIFNNSNQVEFHLMDARNILEINQNFDSIFCAFLAPYLSKNELDKLLQDSSKLLNEQGMIYISAINDNYAKSGIKQNSAGDEMKVYYYLLSDFEEIFSKNGFVIYKHYYYKQLSNGKNENEIVIIAHKL